VLAGGRGGAGRGLAGALDPDRRGDGVGGKAGRVAVRDDDFRSAHLRIGRDILRSADDAECESFRLQPLPPDGPGFANEDIVENGDQLAGMVAPGRRPGEAGVRAQVRPVERAKETDLIFVGRTEDRKKGIVHLLEALARTPDRIRLKIVDGRIPDGGLVPRALRRLGLERRVTLLRRMLTVPELVSEYSSARIALVPSYFEGFGFPASEAMAAGLPVIATRNGALPEVVGETGDCGRLVPFRDVEALAVAIRDLASLPPDTLAKMGEAARQRVLRVFSWRRAARETADVLAEAALAQRRSRAAGR